MKINSTLFVVLALICLGNVAFAQNAPFTFKVLVSKGKTEVKTSETWQTLKIGASLKASDEVKVSENSYLALIHENGTPLEVKEAGDYKVSALVSRLPKKAGALNKYTDFILSKNEDKKVRLGATGAVERTIKDMVLVYLPGSEKSDVYGDKIYLEWTSDEVKAPYVVIFSNFMEEDLGRFETDKPSFTIAINEGKFQKDNLILVRVVSKNTPGQGSKAYTIKKLRTTDRDRIAAAYNQVKGSIDQNTALGQYLLAGFYEENLLLIDALTAYHQAAALAPDVELYKAAYEEFLTRMEFK
ncbi:MAG: hypothetical protein U0U09_09455 [Cyclobacteriaceae bacterium]